MSENVSKKLSKVIKIDGTQIQQHLDHLVRGSVEDAINNFLDAEA